MPGWTFEAPNPIAWCAVQVALDGVLSEPVIRDISGLHNQFKRELPRKMEQQLITVQMNLAPGQALGAPTPQLGGVVFDSLRPDGQPSRSLTVSQNAITFTTMEYSRWEEFWPLAERVVKTVALRAAVERRISGIVLEYNDQFYWKDDATNINIGELFNNMSPYLPKNFIDRQDLCHNFQGWRARAEDILPAFQINSINASIKESPKGKICTTIINHRLQFDDQKTGECLFAGDDASRFNRLVRGLHDTNKQLLRGLLTKEMVESIPGLGDD